MIQCNGNFIHNNAIAQQLSVVVLCAWDTCVSVCSVCISIWFRLVLLFFYMPWNSITCPIVLQWIASLVSSQKCVKTFKLEHFSRFSFLFGDMATIWTLEWVCSSSFKLVTLFYFLFVQRSFVVIYVTFSFNTHSNAHFSPSLFLCSFASHKNPCNKFINSSELCSRSKPVSFLLMAISFWPLSNSLSAENIYTLFGDGCCCCK